MAYMSCANDVSQACTKQSNKKNSAREVLFVVLDLLGRKREKAARRIAYQKNGAR